MIFNSVFSVASDAVLLALKLSFAAGMAAESGLPVERCMPYIERSLEWHASDEPGVDTALAILEDAIAEWRAEQ